MSGTLVESNSLSLPEVKLGNLIRKSHPFFTNLDCQRKVMSAHIGSRHVEKNLNHETLAHINICLLRQFLPIIEPGVIIIVSDEEFLVLSL